MADLQTKVIELARRRGIFWPSYEIYGGVAGLYDIGPIGVRIKNKIVDLWRKHFIKDNSDFVVEIDTPALTPYKVLEASGHVDNFTDPVVECNSCHNVYRADHLVEEIAKVTTEGLPPSELDKIIREKGIKCPKCGGELGEVRLFNLLFETRIGPYSTNKAFLRPETAQGMFTSFKRVYEAFRQKLPIGIAQIGKVGRNEISPRQGLIRMREFTIMEVEFFFDPNSDVEPPLDRLYDLEINILRGDDKARGEEKYTKYKFSEIVNEKIVINKWMAYWMGIASNFVNSLGISSFYFEEKLPHERAHYSKQTFDQIVVIDNVKVEISGHAYRSDYDLSRHSAYSGQDLSIFKKFDTPKIVKKKTLILNKDLVTKEGRDFSKTIMEIINTKTVEEIERMILNKEKVLGKDIDMYVKIVEREEKISGERVIPHVIEPSFGVERCLYLTLLNSYMEKDGRIILSLPKRLSPYDIAIFPLLEKDELIKKAREIYDSLKERYDIIFDDSGSIGKRYARVDEIGVPYSITVDPMTLTDNTVTIRDRDSWQQIRVNITDLMNVLDRLFKGEDFNKLGKLVSNNE
ncbi:glycine--tRNA ligase [Sulfolobus acidocaldarius]|uniref:glycine--tRNA ligase n=4 Tax=Sulfolobus acidocaldarius TaxID=2285 RepID=Q4JAF0_SULAC|nr:glycine--tRNA ligase [Sulfolobus acidocaldarius]AAY80229.1 glycyl-tRNA synthetase class II [Sulfolobus acidocaldarius DSM 639]AGE70808.1 glycyl-tRNA synthetase [Sulfolobus acidocaldarius N8]AGE73079.1 glycyl-tRNA synthetase [Sulfolobus acidocaldarius Ron12/I]ALU28874.1 glycine--tRNA ligase [Sulfolobus acidocaldarius]ALU31596.1 glycine--tRNA ligase [Sulfolobus acidocaldarius]